MHTEFLVPTGLINILYLAASLAFILAIQGLTHPRTAVRGNLLGAFGMGLAIVATLLARGVSFPIILAGSLVGGLIGLVAAKRIPMTAMPEMVALFNGFGGAASVLVAGAVFVEFGARLGEQGAMQPIVATALSGIIGAVTFWGSLIAYLKLAERMTSNAVHYPLQQPLNALLALVALGCAGWVIAQPDQPMAYWALCGVASILGVTLVLPIGGADMPVVIALLNSYSGLAGAATGFVLDNNVLIIAGSLVGASGLILTSIMCKAMNRSLGNVVFGKLGPTATTASADSVYGGKVKSATPEEVAMLFDGARRCVIVPGYGMAVSQAQHTVRDLANVLAKHGTEVEYAIHPVAGRMPGHMNVLLAEAEVPYDQMIEMDNINPTMDTVDVCMVIGANDVVNPDARKPESVIAGMPIIDVDKARTVVVVKRSLSPGFAGIPNPLFAAENTLMMFGDGKKAIQELVTALKES